MYGGKERPLVIPFYSSFTFQIWNRKEGRKATMKEIIQYVIGQLKIHKRK
ncbi:hypothetical protein ERO13_D10G231200v2 [Gossypium hirsutum]|uniref:Factor of DNA methylation 1-5/IDN2 domain-containing protein n=1 Tax=Gossypium barbadense TaxID=3634 RepID=A0A5J5PW57_GOSBA|nr:hypothetical protein ES319_D10G263600v1 [Gossypium barbadense]KAG4127703.1 hypothetical protein ERO13_D10G231200v2 [Gossypium hirsutum]